MNQENKQKYVVQNNVNIFAALAIFVNHAPRLINGILDAAETQDLSLAEETAAKLSLYSNNAQLPDFTQNIHTLIIAARERKLPVVKSQAEKLREIFEQITKSTSATELDKEMLI